jgi:hypothetical protein
VIERGLLGDRSGPLNDREVFGELKLRMIHPDWSTAPDRHVDEPLTQPWNQGQAVLQRFDQPRSIEGVADIEQEYGPHLHRGIVTVGDQRHGIVPAGAFDPPISANLHDISVAIGSAASRAPRH